MYRWGDLTSEAYPAERDRLQRELAGPRTTTEQAGFVTRAAAFLRDLPTAWAAAAPEQRNQLARLIVEAVEVRDDRVVAIVPQPDFAPFFVAATRRNNAGGVVPPTGVVNPTMDRRKDSGAPLWYGCGAEPTPNQEVPRMTQSATPVYRFAVPAPAAAGGQLRRRAA